MEKRAHAFLGGVFVSTAFILANMIACKIIPPIAAYVELLFWLLGIIFVEYSNKCVQ